MGVIACESRPSSIPAVDGRLNVRVVFPTTGTTIPANDSIAIWGTIGTGRGELQANGQRVAVESNGTFASIVSVPGKESPRLVLVARRGEDSARHEVRLRREADETPGTPEGSLVRRLRWVRVRRLPSDTADSATQWRPVFSRWRPDGTVAVPLPQGIVLRSDAASPRWLRLRLTADELVWIPATDGDTTVARGVDERPVELPSIASDSDNVRLSIRLPEAVPATVEYDRDRLLWTLYGVGLHRPAQAIEGDGDLVRQVEVHRPTGSRVTVEVRLATVPLGWRSSYANGAMHLVIRRPLRPSGTLEGLRVVLDAGHPPDGSTGPSGLTEDSVTLAVAQHAATRLRAAGAAVRMTRTTAGRVSLEARAAIADRADADVFVSIHANAPAAGRAPERVDGTTVFFQHATGMALAAALQGPVSRAFGYESGQRLRGDYAVLRSTWMPSALIEGTGIVMPEREAFLRTEAGIDAWAAGIVEGLQRWRGNAGRR